MFYLCSILIFYHLLFLGYITYNFNQFWFDSKPDNVMSFPRIKDQFSTELKKELCERPVSVKLSLS